ncbi:hypothetical protein C8Q74DRAFT_1373408 [Fomes fomentarius]|nr:hypothetical protein C8Q74DRAFT_1373408 [Fomes fomentarius]
MRARSSSHSVMSLSALVLDRRVDYEPEDLCGDLRLIIRPFLHGALFGSLWTLPFRLFAPTIPGSIVLNLFSDALLTVATSFGLTFVPYSSPAYVLYRATFGDSQQSYFYFLLLADSASSQKPDAFMGSPNYFFGVAKKLGIAYTTMVISNEVFLTALICARIMHIWW